MTDIIEDFDIPKATSSIITVVGVGGGGGNAVNHMYNMGIHNVTFMICNTDKQALFKSPIPVKIQLGKTLTEGLGAGNRPERGRDAAMESIDEIKETLMANGTKMVFITAGMGGGTGTGAAPVIAQVARELGILTVAIVTMPFRTEGPKRLHQAIQGIEEIKKHVDSLLIIDNNNISRMYGELPVSQAFGKADDILTIAAKGIAEIITKESYMNVDFADVQTVMSDSGVAVMGSAVAGIADENAAIEVTKKALLSPLLNQNDISGAKNILVNISWADQEFTMDDVYRITEYIQNVAGNDANLIPGIGKDESLNEGEVSVTIIATGFNTRENEQMIESVEHSAARPGTGKEERPPVPARTEAADVRPPIVEYAVAGPKGEAVKRVGIDDEPAGEGQASPEGGGDDLFQLKIKESPAVAVAGGVGSEGTVGSVGNVGGGASFAVAPEEKTSFSLYDEEPVKADADGAGGAEEFIVQTRDTAVTPEEVQDELPENFLVNPVPLDKPKGNRRTAPLAPRHREAIAAGEDSVFMSIDELEELPAYQRRKIQIHNERVPVQGRKVSRLTLKDDN